MTSKLRVWSAGKPDPSATFGDSAAHLNQTTFTFEDIRAYDDEVAGMESMILDGADLVIPHADSEMNVRTVEALPRSAAEGRPIQVTSVELPEE